MEYPTINLIERCDDILQENLYLVNSKKIHLKIHSTIGNKKYTFADVGVKDTDAVIKRYGYFTNIEKHEHSQKNLLKFRGGISAYPTHKLKVKLLPCQEYICDIIIVNGGQEKRPPYGGFVPFCIGLYSVNFDRQVTNICKLQLSEGELDIETIPNVGQIMIPCDIRSLMNLITHKTLSYQGWTSCQCEDFKDREIIKDTFITKLHFFINFQSQCAHIEFKENIWQRSTIVRSHASDDEEETEYEDRYIKASFVFSESSLIEFILNVQTIASWDGTCFVFHEKTSKRKFEDVTGIHLIETIKSYSNRTIYLP